MARMFGKLTCFVALFGFALANTAFENLKKRFNDANTAVFLENNDLESRAKASFRKFLTKASLAQKDRIESYFTEWRKCVDLDGPFDNKEKSDGALQALMNPSDFQASLFMEQLLQNRDDSEDAIKDFRNGITTNETKRIQLYFAGDGDIISAVIVLSEKSDGQCVVLNFMLD